ESPFQGGWQYIRATPDLRAYVPLPLGLVVAARFAIGVEEILWHDPALPERIPDIGQQAPSGGFGPGLLGPDPYRLRGGGANSDRGYLPGQLGGPVNGDIPIYVSADNLRAQYATLGGVRRWEASLELRIPFSKDFSLVLFADMGDVSPTREFRFYA